MDTSWKNVGKWYDKAVGDTGHFYHQTVVLPGVQKLLSLETATSLLDVACGQGVLLSVLPDTLTYVGFDAAAPLIQSAQGHWQKRPNTTFLLQRAEKTLQPQWQGKFDRAACILALQNLSEPKIGITRMAEGLQENGIGVIVLNHPCFRIPRQSSWEVDQANGLQYRRVQHYYTPLKIPIAAQPSQGARSEVTWSFHFPLSAYFSALAEQGCVVTHLEEWCSPKVSQGKAAKMENRSRAEFPLFLALRFVKQAK